MTGRSDTRAEAGLRDAVACLSNRRRLSAWALCVLAAAAPAALAQSANCEAFKERLAATIESNGVRGYALEIVPSGSPPPPGARSLGTCDGGAYTVLYWRWALARAGSAPAAPPALPTPVDAAPAATPRPAPAPASAAEPRSLREPKAMSEVNAARNATRDSKTEATAAREPQATATSRPSPANLSAAPEVAVATNPPPAASGVSVAPSAAPWPAAAHGAEPAGFAGIARVAAFVVSAAAAIVAGLFAWHWMRRRRYYDEAGLPRGPRIRLR